jgi:hypothetical protein
MVLLPQPPLLQLRATRLAGQFTLAVFQPVSCREPLTVRFPS